MDGIQSVQQLDDTHVRWVAGICGESRRWTTEITEQEPDEKRNLPGSLGAALLAE
jgi:uncharacterized membrane protein